MGWAARARKSTLEKRDRSQGLVKTAAAADERLSSPPPLNRRQILLLPEQVVDVLLFKVAEREASQGSVFLHAASPHVLTPHSP